MKMWEPAATANDGSLGDVASDMKLEIATGVSNRAWSDAFWVPFQT